MLTVIMWSAWSAGLAPYPPSGVIPIIFDTDMGPDVDDVGALAILHKFADAGICNIIAIGVCSPEPYSAGCADAINTYYNRPNIPIGIVTAGTPTSQRYSKPVTEQFPNDLKNSMNSIPNAVTVYRQALVAEPDSSVVFVAVGFTTILSQLLKSGADNISPLIGVDLVRRKARMLVDMGGQYDTPAGGCEYNFYNDAPSAQYVTTNWPTPILFSGGELGWTVVAGGALASKTPASNPVRKAYEIYSGAGNNRNAWDLMTALYACTGASNYWTIHSTGHVQVGSGGCNTWVEQTPASKEQGYLVAKMSSDALGAVLDSIITLPPQVSTATKQPVLSLRPHQRPGISLVCPSTLSRIQSGGAYGISGRRIRGDRVPNQLLIARTR